MTLPSRIAAVVLLLASLGLVFVLVSNAGVSTDVFLADPTLTPMPAPNAANWSELMEGQLIYQDNPEAPFNVTYTSTTIDSFAEVNGLQPPAEDSETPLADLLAQLRAGLEEQVASYQLMTPNNAFTGPVTEDMGGVSVTYIRAVVPPQNRISGEPFNGLDLVLALLDQGNSQIMRIQYIAQGESDPVAYRDFMAWLSENAAELAEPEPEATEEAVVPAVTEEAEPAATEEPAPAATEEAVPAATEESEPGATEEAVAPALTEEAEPAATEEPSATEEAVPAATEEAAISSAPADEAWVEQTSGQLSYARDPELPAQITYGALTIEDFITQSQLAPLPEDTESPALEILNRLAANFNSNISSLGLQVEDDAITGPAIETISGIETAVMRLKINAQPIGEQQFPGMDMFLAVMDHGDGTMTLVQYALQGPPDETVYEDMRAWLETNAERLATLEPEVIATAEAPEQ